MEIKKKGRDSGSTEGGQNSERGTHKHSKPERNRPIQKKKEPKKGN